MNIEIACVCESWFDSKSGVFSKTIRDVGYKLHHAHREQKRGGGVAILYKKHMSVKEGEASVSRYLSFEYVCVTVHLTSKKKLLVACIYRKQEVKFSTFIEEFSTLMDRMVFRGDAMLLVGDFNVWVDVEDDTKGKQLSSLMSSFGRS